MTDWIPVQCGEIDLSPLEVDPSGMVRNTKRKKVLTPLSDADAIKWWRKECRLFKEDIRTPSDLIDPFIQEATLCQETGNITRAEIKPRKKPLIRWLYHPEKNYPSGFPKGVSAITYSVPHPPEWTDMEGDPKEMWFVFSSTEKMNTNWQTTVFHGPSIRALINGIRETNRTKMT